MDFKYSYDHINFDKNNTKEKLLMLLKDHEEESFIYSIDAARLNAAISIEMGLSEEGVFKYFQCGVFHDIGKLGMAKEFINYPRAFTIGMYQEMKKHAAGGGAILKKIGAEQELINTASFHHCNFDGTGYPGGKFEDEIPLEARMTRITDSADAYMSKRCYKEGGPTNLLIEDLYQYKGTSYDPELLSHIKSVHDKVMNRSHEDGLDHPSKKMYMHYLKEEYGSEAEKKFMDDVFNHYNPYDS